MIVVQNLFALATFGLLIAYLRRVDGLQWGPNPLVFCLQHALTACACMWSAYTTHRDGFDVLSTICPIWAALYLFRSHDAYKYETTRPAPLGEPILSRLFHH